MKTNQAFLVLVLAACAACSSDDESTGETRQSSESADDEGEPTGMSTATPDDPAPDVSHGDPASADELCAEVEGGQGVGYIPPHPSCEEAACGDSCDPCEEDDDCEPADGNFACNRHLLCVPVEE